MKYELDAISNIETIRELNEIELAQREKDLAKFDQIDKIKEAKKKLKTDIIARLGLTLEEAEAFLS